MCIVKAEKFLMSICFSLLPHRGRKPILNFSFSPAPRPPTLAIPPPPSPLHFHPPPFRLQIVHPGHYDLQSCARHPSILPSTHSLFPAGNKHDHDMTSRNRQPNRNRITFWYPFVFEGGWFKPFRREAYSLPFCGSVACSCIIAILGACVLSKDTRQTIQATSCQWHYAKLVFKVLESTSNHQCQQQFFQRLYLHRITATVITWVNSWQLRTQLICEDVDAALWNGIMASQLLDEKYHRLWLSSVLQKLILQCFKDGLLSN